MNNNSTIPTMMNAACAHGVPEERMTPATAAAHITMIVGTTISSAVVAVLRSAILWSPVMPVSLGFNIRATNEGSFLSGMFLNPESNFSVEYPHSIRSHFAALEIDVYSSSMNLDMR